MELLLLKKEIRITDMVPKTALCLNKSCISSNIYCCSLNYNKKLIRLIGIKKA